MAIQGVRLTNNFVTDARPKNWREGILLLFPNGKAPLFALTAGMKKRVTDDAEFNWWEKTMETQRTALTTDISAGLTAIPVGATAGVNNALIAGWKKGTMVRVEQSNEIMLVTADPVTGQTTATVSRGLAGTTAAAVSAGTVTGINPNLQSIGSLYEENSSAPTGINFDPTKRNNFTQIFRDTLEMSRTAQKTRLRTGDQVREAKRETLQIHSANIERALWFGRGLETGQTINGRLARTTFGIQQYLMEKAPAVNVVNEAANATFTLADLEDWMEISFRFGSTEKMVFCGNVALLEIQRAIRLATNVHLNIQSGLKEFGMSVMRLISPFGTWVLKTHPLFNQITGGSAILAGTYRGTNTWLFVMDMENLVYRYLTDSDTKYEPKLEANDLDGMKSGYLTECGLEIQLPETHMVIKNLGAGAAA